MAKGILKIKKENYFFNTLTEMGSNVIYIVPQSHNKISCEQTTIKWNDIRGWDKNIRITT